MKYAKVDATGLFEYSVFYSNPEFIPVSPEYGFFVSIDDSVNENDLINSFYDEELGGFVKLPDRPPNHVFDKKNKKWVLDVQSASNEARENRNRLLSLSDWTQLPDAPTDKDAWAVYRQHLRDITKQNGFPTKIDWGTPPSEE